MLKLYKSENKYKNKIFYCLINNIKNYNIVLI